MSSSPGFHISLIMCSVLLSSTSLQCLSLPKPKRDTVQVQQTALTWNGLEDKRMSMQSLENNQGPSEQITSVAVAEEPSGVSAEPSGTSLNKIFTVKGGVQHTSLSDSLTRGSKSLNVYLPTESMVAADESEFSPTGPSKELNENGVLKTMLTTALTTLSPDAEADVLSSTVLKMMEGGSTETGFSFTSYPDNGFFRTEAIEGRKKAPGSSDLSATPPLSNENLPTLHPRSQNLEGASDSPTSPLLLADQTADSEHETLGPNTDSLVQLTAADARTYALTVKQTFVPTTASLNLETKPDTRPGSLHVTASVIPVAPAVPLLSDDWDDTKLGTINQARGSKQEEIKQNYVVAEPPWTMVGDEDEDDVKRAMPSAASAYATTMKLEKNMSPGPAQLPGQRELMPTLSADQTSVYLTNPLAEAEVTTVNIITNTEPVTMDDRISVSLSLPETVTMMDTKSNVFLTPGNTLKGVTPETMTAGQETDATMPVMTPAGVDVRESTSEVSMTKEERKGVTPIPSVSSVAQLSNKSEHPDATISFTATHLSVAKPPDAEVFTDLVTVSEEESVTALPEASETLAGMRMHVGELTSRAATLATPALMASSVRRTVVPSVRRISTAVTYGLDRLESEEGEEEEEEEEEEDEEEEEEEDRDTDSMEESLEGDTDLPGFTLPGETSQEPLAGLGDSAAQLAGVSYQVPDTIEWEQQNQGLVRSWMEKLKDKAGYMSGMLVPVGVGIAGALFILGALYSIKIMNRRRRNGSKRHKRKQREFNSMQDRVMLLADSSEDEF